MLKRAYKDHIKSGHCRREWNLQSSDRSTYPLFLSYVKLNLTEKIFKDMSPVRKEIQEAILIRGKLLDNTCSPTSLETHIIML
jgi:hypothetical protein